MNDVDLAQKGHYAIQAHYIIIFFILTCHFQVRRGSLRSPNPIGQLTNITASVVRLDGADDEVAAGLDVDPAVHAAQAGDGDVVSEPGN